VRREQQDIRQVLRKLAHFNPTCKDDYGHEALDYLVLDALVSYGQTPVTVQDIKGYLKATYAMDFEDAEIDATSKRLSGKHLISCEEKGRYERPMLKIYPEVESNIRKQYSETQNRESEVFSEWKEELSNRYKKNKVIIENIDRIVDNLHFFTRRMLRKHGVESVAVLYPESHKAQSWLSQSEAEKTVFDQLPSIDSFTDAVARLEILRFFRDANPKRKTYISSLFNASFFWHLIQVDNKCTELLREVVKGQRLYLDNNVLYSLVGFDGSEVLQSVHIMLKCAGQLGYKLWVTTKTLDEFQNSLLWRLNKLKEKPPLPRELARIALELLNEDNIVTSYWQEFVKNSTTIEEFIAERSHIEQILDGLNVEETNKFRKEIEESEELLDEMSTLRTVLIGQRSESVIEHDAFHRVFVNKLRKGPRSQFRNAAAWYLTHDRLMPAYDRVARKGKPFLPFCLTTDQWIQINRPLLTRTSSEQEYEQSFHSLVVQPFIRSMMASFSMTEAVNEVLGRLNRFEDMSPQLALEVVTDSHFMVSMSNETDENEREKKIKNKLVDVAADFQEQNVALEKNVSVKEIRVKKLEEQVAVLRSDMKAQQKTFRAQQRTFEIAQQDYENTAKKLENVNVEKEQADKAIRELNQLRESIQSEKDDIQNQLAAYKSNIKKWGIFGILTIFASALWWMHHLLISWPWLTSHSHETSIKIAIQLAIVCLLLCYPMRKHWYVWVSIAALFVGGALFA